MTKNGKVKCLECGNYYKQIMETHLKAKHNMTMKEYKKKHNNPVLIAEESKNIGDKNPFYGKKHKPEIQKRINKKLKVSMNSAETQAKLRARDYEYMKGDTNPAKRDDVRDKVSKGVKKSYTEELKQLRSVTTKEIRATESDEKKKQRSERLFKSMVKAGKWVDPKLKSKFARYKQNVLKLTERQFKLHQNKIKNSHKRGCEFNLDHRYSIYDGFHNNIDPSIIAHWKNFQIISKSENSQKHTNSSVSIDDLQLEIRYVSI